jgi:protein-S-isoprenylcysteine O-methyltransferase Ste14
MQFKLAFIVAFVLAAAIAASATRRAARRHGGSLNQLTHEVPGLLIVRAALGLIFYAALISWMFGFRAAAWTYFPVPATVRWLAVVMLAPAIALLAWSFRTLGESYRGGVGLYDAHELVTTGPYRLVRHPIYLSFVAVMLLVLVLSANWVLGLSGLLLVVSIAAARIATEERQLLDRFGPAWEEYRTRTGRLFPRLRKEGPSQRRPSGTPR